MINRALEEFVEFEKADPDAFRRFKREIRKQELAENQNERKIEEIKKRDEFIRKKEEQEKLRRGKHMGKLPMFRSKKPPPPKKEEKKQKYNDEEMDQIYYGLQALVDLKQEKDKNKPE